MHGCERCEYLGYVESWYQYGGKWRPSIQQCLHCRDAVAYTNRLQQALKEATEPRPFPSQPPSAPRRPSLRLVK